mgnify:CR=1 FL=1
MRYSLTPHAMWALVNVMIYVPFDLFKKVIYYQSSKATTALSNLYAAKESWVIDGKKLRGIVVYPPTAF